jgi:hypothetical protein
VRKKEQISIIILSSWGRYKKSTGSSTDLTLGKNIALSFCALSANAASNFEYPE